MGKMKSYTRVYVKNSFEAAETYCKAFGAEITREFRNEDNTAYEHCELSVNGEGFLALAEAKNPCDINIVHKYKWETMTFNAFEMRTEDSYLEEEICRKNSYMKNLVVLLYIAKRITI